MDYIELCNMITELSGIPSDHIHKDSQLNIDLGLCSYDIMTLVAMIEAKTKKEIDMLGLSKQNTVGYLLEYINK